MLHILFLILKIIGILILVLLGLVLLLATLVLFVPVCYRAEAKAEGSIASLSLRAKASWLLFLVSVCAVYEEQKFEWTLRICGIKVRKRKKKTPDLKETENPPIMSREHVADERNAEAEAEQRPEKQKEQKKGLLNKIKCTIKNICDKIKKIWKFVKEFYAFLTDSAHVLAFQKFKAEILSLAKHLKPRKLKGTVRFGLEDPYHTGQVLAGLSVLYPFYGERISIIPDFEEKGIEGNVYAKGHIRTIYFLRMILKLFFDKDVKLTYKNYKKIKF